MQKKRKRKKSLNSLTLRRLFAASAVKKFPMQFDMNHLTLRCAVLELLGSALVDGHAVFAAIQPIINLKMDTNAHDVANSVADGFIGIHIAIW
jgi:hypothetical protein